MTALHYACVWENHAAVRAILHHPGIILNFFSRNGGNTPLLSTICISENLFEDMERNGLCRHHKAWDMTSLRLLLDFNECLILARNKSGHHVLDFARNRLLQICNVPKPNQCESLTKDFLNIIAELEKYFAKARWKMFQYILNPRFHTKPSTLTQE